MPQAVAHILIPLVLASILRHYYNYKKGARKFSSKYVLIIGLAGIIPDLDVVAYWFLHFFGFSLGEVHRTFSHTIFVPILFALIGLLTTNINPSLLQKNRLKLNLIFYCFAVGSLVHIILDGIFVGYIMPVYPFSKELMGINLFGYLPNSLEAIAPASFDAGLLIIYLIYLELKHKISDFI